MKDTGPEAVPPEDSSSFDDRMRERLSPAPEPPLKIRPSSRYQFRIESMVSSTARMKQAETCCGDEVPTLNQTGELNANTWCSSIQVSSWEKISSSCRGGEVAVLSAGVGVRRDNPVDDLLQAGLAARCADSATEVLAGDDVGGVDRPEVGELDTALLEVDGAVAPVGQHHVAALPGHLVVRMDAGGGVETLQPNAGRSVHLGAPALGGSCAATGDRTAVGCGSG